MTFENELPLPDYDGGPRDRLREQAREAEILRHAKHVAWQRELTDIIAKAVRPWIGDDAESSVGITALNNEMAQRAAAQAVKDLLKSNRIKEG